MLTSTYSEGEKIRHHPHRFLEGMLIAARVVEAKTCYLYVRDEYAAIRELIDEYCGGMQNGHSSNAYLPGGASGGILPASLDDLPLDFGTLEPYGCFIGSAAVVVLSDRDNMKSVALNLMRFFEDESCGQGTPCRVGTEKAVALLARDRWDPDLLSELSRTMADASICGLGQAAGKPTAGMVVRSANERARTAQRMVMELLLTDQPAREVAHDRDSHLWQQAERVGVRESRFPCREPPAPDSSHPAMRVALDACIHCSLCLRACREVQVNDVIGMAIRGHRSKIVFDQDDAMGASTCVGCGECVQACPTGALMPTTLVDAHGLGSSGGLEEVHSVCPFCGVGCQLTYLLREQKIVGVKGRAGPANEGRLCVKGRFGLDYIHSPQRLTKPLIRRGDAAKRGDLGSGSLEPVDSLPGGELERGAGRRRRGSASHPRPGTGRGPFGIRLCQVL